MLVCGRETETEQKEGESNKEMRLREKYYETMRETLSERVRRTSFFSSSLNALFVLPTMVYGR